ncbi:hypothetical protein HDU86_005100 [Geranomyces michiganensis]|nr:hypothetical protein HDU86_005100 [Geranomyces michiganensis]
MHSTGLMDMVTTSDGDAAVSHAMANPAFTQFRQSSMEYDALMSSYMTGEVTSLMQQDELDLLLTPLISPAMTPGVDFQHLSLNQMNETFSPLSSPALRPQDIIDFTSSYYSPALPPSANGNYIGSHSELSGSSSYAASPAVHPSAANHASLGMLDQSPALGPAQMQLRTSLVGVSPALQPTLDSWALPAAATTAASRRRESLQSPLLSALREKGKKAPLSAPYTVPRTKSLSLISPALMPLPNGRRRSSKSPDTMSGGSNASDAGLQTPPSTLETGPVFKEPFPIQPKARPQKDASAFKPIAAADLLTSPALTPQLGPQAATAVAAAASGHLSLAPITPAQLMQLDNAQLPQEDTAPSLTTTPASSTHSLISPSLKPLLPSGSSKNLDATLRLTEKSNYQNMREGNTDKIGLKYDGDVTTTVEAKRDCHKQAEQRRRDTLKQCFEDLRVMLPPIEEKNPSKVLVLKKSCEYIHYLQNREKDTNALLKKLRADLAARK